MKIIRKQTEPKFVEQCEMKIGTVCINSEGYLLCRDTYHYTKNNRIRVKNLDFEIPEGKYLPLGRKDRYTVYNGWVEIDFAEPKTVEIGSLEEDQWFSHPNNPHGVFQCGHSGRGLVPAFFYQEKLNAPVLLRFPEAALVTPIPAPTIIIGDEDENKDKE